MRESIQPNTSFHAKSQTDIGICLLLRLALLFKRAIATRPSILTQTQSEGFPFTRKAKFNMFPLCILFSRRGARQKCLPRTYSRPHNPVPNSAFLSRKPTLATPRTQNLEATQAL